MRLQRVCIVIISLFLFVPLAHAQPEMEVGQEILVIQRNDCGYYQYGARVLKISGDFAELEYVHGGGGGLIELNIPGCENYSFGMPMIIKISETEYSILKPAPRPEFEFTTCGSSLICIEANLVKMADELRWLRKEIKALKK